MTTMNDDGDGGGDEEEEEQQEEEEDFQSAAAASSSVYWTSGHSESRESMLKARLGSALTLRADQEVQSEAVSPRSRLFFLFRLSERSVTMGSVCNCRRTESR